MDKVKLQKGNRIIVVSEDRKNAFLKRGYDVVNKQGKVVEHATGGATVEIAKYNKVVKELEETKEAHDEIAEALAEAQDSDSAKELEEAKKEISKLKGENTRLKKQIDEKAK